jgi:aconitase A
MLDDLPYAIRVLLESVLRQAGSEHITEQDVIALAGWSPKRTAYAIIPFLQMRVVMQDFTGVPAVVDLAAMQSALPKMGGATIFIPTGENMSIYEAATKYEADATHLIVLAGKEYGTGSSRDWAAKGTYLLGVRSVIAESY